MLLKLTLDIQGFQGVEYGRSERAFKDIWSLNNFLKFLQMDFGHKNFGLYMVYNSFFLKLAGPIMTSVIDNRFIQGRLKQELTKAFANMLNKQKLAKVEVLSPSQLRRRSIYTCLNREEDLTSKSRPKGCFRPLYLNSQLSCIFNFRHLQIYAILC